MEVRKIIDQIDRALRRIGIEAVLEPRRQPSRDNRRARKTIVPSRRLSIFAESSRDPVEPVWPVHVVLDVFLAGPHNLHRAIDLFGNLNGSDDAIDIKSSSEPAADEMIVDHHLVERQTEGLRGSRLGT